MPRTLHYEYTCHVNKSHVVNLERDKKDKGRLSPSSQHSQFPHSECADEILDHLSKFFLHQETNAENGYFRGRAYVVYNSVLMKALG
jgi:hypothetical protein